MITFLEFLNEATVKKPPFQKTLKELHKKMVAARLAASSYHDTISFAKSDTEQATFNLRIWTKNTGNIPTDVAAHHERLHEALVFLGAAHPDTVFGGSTYLDNKKFNFTGLNGWEVEIDFGWGCHEYGGEYVTNAVVTIKGGKVKAGKTEFDKFPEIRPDAILVSSGGYTMTLVRFFKVKRRDGMKVSVVEMTKRAVEGQLGETGKCVPDREGTKLLGGRIGTDGRVKIDEYSYKADVWDGKPEYFNHID